MAEDSCCFQLISDNGAFNVEGLENFTKTTNLSRCDLSYAVVAIMGPQSSGKSTLLNEVFQTNFRTMDADEGRSQTTRGVWIAKGMGIEPFTIAMDVEGTDSSEGGEDKATFERRCALFALTVADVVIINMWCQDIGRDHAANRPLLQTIFEVMIPLFGARKTTLYFVLRDKTRTPLERLKRDLREDIEKIWAATAKPEAYKWTPLSEFFNVEITALSSYEYAREKFKEEVDRLRQRFFHSISPGGLAGDRKDVELASGFAFLAKQTWETIKENKDLDLPALEVMVATYRCEEIAKEKLSSLTSDKTWLAMKEALEAGPVSEFGEKLSSILENYLSEYDKEAIYYEKSIRDDKRQQLETEALKVVHPAYVAMLEHLRTVALESFKSSLEQKRIEEGGFEAFVDSCAQSSVLDFEKGCEDASIRQVNDWDASEAREKLRCNIERLKSLKKAKHKVMVATFRRGEIAMEKLSSLTSGKTWLPMRAALEAGPVLEFGEKLSSILENYLSQYDKEAIYYTKSIGDEKQQELVTEALKVVHPAYVAMLERLRTIALESFKSRLEQDLNEEGGFEAFVDLCAQSSMLDFGKGCEE